jgi:hypothetical protein
VNEAVATDGDGDMRSIVTSPLGIEEDQISGFDVGRLDSVADLVLLLDDAWNIDAVLGKDVLHESAAIEPGWIGPAKPVRDAAKTQGKLGD